MAAASTDTLPCQQSDNICKTYRYIASWDKIHSRRHCKHCKNNIIVNNKSSFHSQWELDTRQISSKVLYACHTNSSSWAQLAILWSNMCIEILYGDSFLDVCSTCSIHQWRKCLMTQDTVMYNFLHKSVTDGWIQMDLLAARMLGSVLQAYNSWLIQWVCGQRVCQHNLSDNSNHGSTRFACFKSGQSQI